MHELVSRLANPFGHLLAESVRKFWFCQLASACVDLRVRLARALHKDSSTVE